MGERPRLLPKGTGKAFLISASTGLGFSLLFLAFMAISGNPVPERSLQIMIATGCASVAGGAGILGAVLDAFLIRRGVDNPSKRRAIAFLAVIVLVFGSTALISEKLVQVAFGPQYIWGVALGFGFGAVVAAVDYKLWQMRQKVSSLEVENRLLSQLAEKDRLLEEASQRLLLSEERNRMARDLHDSVSQGIHGMVYAVHSLERALPHPRDQQVEKILDLLRRTAQSTLSELRAMILELRPSLIDEKGLTEAVHLHCDLFSQRQNIVLEKDIQDCPGLTPEQQVAVYRILQEALNNIQRHSGATKARVTLKTTSEGSAVLLAVEDNGKGFEPVAVPDGGGLHNMKARALENGGALTVESTPEIGTSVKAVFRV